MKSFRKNQDPLFLSGCGGILQTNSSMQMDSKGYSFPCANASHLENSFWVISEFDQRHTKQMNKLVYLYLLSPHLCSFIYIYYWHKVNHIFMRPRFWRSLKIISVFGFIRHVYLFDSFHVLLTTNGKLMTQYCP